MLKGLSLATVAGISVLGIAATSFGYTGEEFAKDARVTFADARAIAVKAFPGKITDEELEKEKGGNAG